jgi:hypothetical protein
MKTILKTGGIAVFTAALLLMVHSCGKSSTTSTDSTNNQAIASAPTAVKMKADFTSSGAPQLFRNAAAPKLTSCPSPTVPDGPNLVAGLDCDGNGGFTAYLTPQSFKVAIKRLSFVKSDGAHVDFVPDQVTLNKSMVYDLTSQITVSQIAISTGTYLSFQAELYYYEIKMPINSSPTITQSIRVYLSDDDFAAEGGLGHHQGDITFIDNNGREMGWAVPGMPWTIASLQTNPALVSRPGGTDPETGHQRGPFGDSSLWNQTAFMQGSGRDIYVINAPLGLTGLTVSADISKTVTFTFSVKDSWFWEDFDADGRFDPCEGTGPSSIEACAAGSKWAPIFNLPVLSIQ